MTTRSLTATDDMTCVLPEHSVETAERAAEAGLVFTSDCLPGIRRAPDRSGAFRYLSDEGAAVTQDERRRIDALKIPPAWTEVWICADSRGHLQATGRDGRGRKQYRYHDAWRALRDETKYERMVSFGGSLSAIRERVDRDLRRPVLDRERVLALVVAVLDKSLIRIGNPRYARDNDSFGATTLQVDHIDVGPTRVQLRFRGKAGKPIDAHFEDPRIARAIRRVRDLPGQELFQYADELGLHVISSSDVNEYLRETTGESVTSKDFRTWGGTLTATLSLVAAEGPPTEAAVTRAVKEAAAKLHNTPAVCRRSYINPRILELYREGGLSAKWATAAEVAVGSDEGAYLDDSERTMLELLRVLEAPDR